MTTLPADTFARTWSVLQAYARRARARRDLIPSMAGRGGNFVESVDENGISIVARRKGSNPEGRTVSRETLERIWTALVTRGFDEEKNHPGRFHQAWWMIYVDAFDDVILVVHDRRWLLWWDGAEDQTQENEQSEDEAPLARHRTPKSSPTGTADPHLRLLEFDPSELERGLKAHWRVEEALSRLITKRGFAPLQPAGEPRFDIAWNDGETFHIVEVKSITQANEAAQLRLGLGQVLHYQHQIAQRGGNFEYVRAVLAIESESTEASWHELCAEANVQLVVAPHFRGLFPTKTK
jgi:hypothetical protein